MESNNELLVKIADWAKSNYVQEQSFLYGPQGPRYVKLNALIEVLKLLITKE